MRIFLKQIPIGTNKRDILEFIAAAIKGGFFSKRSRVTSMLIMEQRNPQHNTMDYHAIVTIEPDSIAERIIQKMNQQTFKGKSIEVRRYYTRDPATDPRKRNHILEEVPESRRRKERRQQNFT